MNADWTTIAITAIKSSESLGVSALTFATAVVVYKTARTNQPKLIPETQMQAKTKDIRPRLGWVRRVLDSPFIPPSLMFILNLALMAYYMRHATPVTANSVFRISTTAANLTFCVAWLLVNLVRRQIVDLIVRSFELSSKMSETNLRAFTGIVDELAKHRAILETKDPPLE